MGSAGLSILLRVAVLGLAAGAVACSTAQAAPAHKPVTAASPPKDDGKPSQAQRGNGGNAHSAALEQLRVAAIAPKGDKQNSVLVPLPDADHWTRVRFLTMRSLVGFRYGKDHHAIVAAFVMHVDDNNVEGACNKSFEKWAAPWIDAFEVELKHELPSAFSWPLPAPPPPAVRRIAIVDVDPINAKTATVLARDAYAAAWASYPAWDGACLVVGVAVPERDDGGRARAVRDRFVKQVFPKITVTTVSEPKESY